MRGGIRALSRRGARDVADWLSGPSRGFHDPDQRLVRSIPAGLTKVDDATLDIYEREAEAIFRRHTSAGRQRHRERAVAHFIGGGATADIGSGSGRDLAWLNANGFPA